MSVDMKNDPDGKRIIEIIKALHKAHKVHKEEIKVFLSESYA